MLRQINSFFMSLMVSCLEDLKAGRRVVRPHRRFASLFPRRSLANDDVIPSVDLVLVRERD